MALEIKKDSIDLGIVVRSADAMKAFYGETLGLPYQASLDMPGGMKMHRYLAGTTVVKLLEFTSPPEAAPAPGGLQGGTGYRYFTITVGNLDAAVDEAKAAGAAVPMGPLAIAPGLRIAMVEDPDGNWVELLEQE